AGALHCRLAWAGFTEEYGTWATGSLLIDAHMLVEGALPPEYGDGDTATDESTLSWAWEGNPGESASALTAEVPTGYSTSGGRVLAYRSERNDAVAVQAGIDGYALFTPPGVTAGDSGTFV